MQTEFGDNLHRKLPILFMYVYGYTAYRVMKWK